MVVVVLTGAVNSITAAPEVWDGQAAEEMSADPNDETASVGETDEPDLSPGEDGSELPPDEDIDADDPAGEDAEEEYGAEPTDGEPEDGEPDTGAGAGVGVGIGILPVLGALDIATQINLAFPGLKAEYTSNDPKIINVSGSYTIVAATYNLNIDQDVTVNWGAEFTGSINSYVLSLTGPGTFNIAAGGSIGNGGTGGAINIIGAGARLNIINGTLFSDINGISVNIAANGAGLTVGTNGMITNSGSASAVNVSTNVTNVLIEVNGGRIISTPSGYAINDGGTSTSTNNTAINIINGGYVEAGSACAIRSTGSGTVVRVTDGTVLNSANTNSNPTIYVNGDPAVQYGFDNVIVEGASVVYTSNPSNTSYVIQTTGNVLIKDEAQVKAIAGRAINLVGKYSTARVAGGVVSSESGVAISTATTDPGSVSDATVIVENGWVYTNSGSAAIQITGTNNAVKISGRGWVTATTGKAVATLSNAVNSAGVNIEITGGFVFAYGVDKNGVVAASPGSVNPTGDGVVVAWTNPGAGRRYVEGTDIDLLIFPTGAAWWHKEGVTGGIEYKNGANGGFFPLADVTIDSTVIKNENLIFDIASGKFYLNAILPSNLYTDQSDKWTWNAGTKTLTLRGFNWATDALAGAVPVALTITGGADIILNLTDANSFVMTGSGANAAGIDCGANITVTGSGALNASASNGTGINLAAGRSLTMNNGAVNAAGGGAGYNGINAARLVINGGVLSASSANAAGVVATYITVAEGDGVLIASGVTKAIESTNPNLTLPGGYAYWRGTKTDGSNASAYAYPSDNAYTHSATYKYVKIQARRRYRLNVVNGGGGGLYFAGELVTINTSAGLAGPYSPTMHPMYYPDQRDDYFKEWTGGNGGTFANVKSPTTVFKMPDNDATVGIVTQTVYKLYVEGGYIFIGPYQSTNFKTGYYPAGAEAPLGTYAQISSEYYFNGWEVTVGTGTIADPGSVFTTFTMDAVSARVVAEPAYVPNKTALYSLTVVNGTGAVSSGVGSINSINAGTWATLTADAPPVGMEFDRWVIVSGATGNAYKGSLNNAADLLTQFIMAEGNVTIEARFRSVDYTAEVINGSGTGPYKYGETVSITAETIPGQSFSHWTVVDGSAAILSPASVSTSFLMPDENVTVIAEYTFDFFTLTVVRGYITEVNGVPVPAGPPQRSGSYNHGDVIKIAADPAAAGTQFTGWVNSSGAGLSVGDIADAFSTATVYVMPAGGAEVEAKYDSNTAGSFVLNVIGGLGSGIYSSGEAATITAYVPPNKRFTGWTTGDNGVFSDSSVSPSVFYMPNNDVTVTANFVDDLYSVTVINGDGSGDYGPGETVAIAAAAQAGKSFTEWSVIQGAVSVNPALGSASAAFVMPGENVTLMANYSEILYKLEVVGGWGGGYYKFGERVTISTDPRRDGQRFGGWTGGDGGEIENPSSGSTIFVMPANNATVTANFINFYELTVIRGSGSGRYNSGDRVMIKADSPGEGQSFSRWTSSNGGSFLNATSSSTYFIMPGRSVIVTANYTEASKTGGGNRGGSSTAVAPAAVKSSVAAVISNPPEILKHEPYVVGIGGGLFAPEKNMTRAEAAQIFYNLLGDKSAVSANIFPDVPPGAWYEKAVGTLAALGIVAGYPDGAFRPGDNVTRAEFVAIAALFEGDSAYPVVWSSTTDVRSSFTDVPDDHWARSKIAAAVGSGWIVGYGDGSFEPDKPISRAEAVTVVNKAEGRCPDKIFIDHSPMITRFTDVPKSHWAFYEITEAYVPHDYLEREKYEEWQ